MDPLKSKRHPRWGGDCGGRGSARFSARLCAALRAALRGSARASRQAALRAALRGSMRAAARCMCGCGVRAYGCRRAGCAESLQTLGSVPGGGGGGRSQRRVGLGPRIIGRPAARHATAADTLCGLRAPPPSLRARCPLVVPPLCAHCCRLSARLHARLCVALRVASARLCVALRAALCAGGGAQKVNIFIKK